MRPGQLRLLLLPVEAEGQNRPEEVEEARIHLEVEEGQNRLVEVEEVL